MRDALGPDGADFWTGAAAVAHTDVAAYIGVLAGWANGSDLPDNWVPSDTFWIVKDGVVVGEICVRHRLNDGLRRMGGHIGYHIHPRFRNRGIATLALGRALDVLAAKGEREALLTCLDSNAASIRVIEKCGGTLIPTSPWHDPKRRRYLIPTPVQDDSASS
jgi:predicted acetyltransferase